MTHVCCDPICTKKYFWFIFRLTIRFFLLEGEHHVSMWSALSRQKGSKPLFQCQFCFFFFPKSENMPDLIKSLYSSESYMAWWSVRSPNWHLEYRLEKSCCGNRWLGASRKFQDSDKGVFAILHSGLSLWYFTKYSRCIPIRLLCNCSVTHSEN